MNVGRTPGIVVITPRICSRFHRSEFVAAILVGKHSPCACEVGIKRGMVIIFFMEIAACRIGLPDFHKSMWNRSPAIIHYASCHDDSFAEWLSRMLSGQVTVCL